MPLEAEQLEQVYGMDAVLGADASRRWELDRDLSRRDQVVRVGLLMLAIAIAQAVLYGSSLIGLTVILPLGTLAQTPVYYPADATTEAVEVHDYGLTDLIFFMEPERQFVVSELKSGRLPIWTPYRFGGAPCWPLGLSPPWWPAYFIQSPVVLAWTQMLVAQVAGLGAYLFFRRTLKVSFWPAMIIACCYPLSGAYTVWTGFWLPAVMCWMPWMFTAVHATVHRPLGFGGPSLSLVTLFALIGGAADIAGQVLLASGLYGAWCLIHRFRSNILRSPAIASATALAIGWGLGFLASAWLMMPLLEYTSTGTRMVNRSHGAEARPPMGLVALPEFVFPSFYGSTRAGSYRLIPNAYPESAVGGYVGMLATLFAAPLAFWSRRHRSVNLFWVFLIFFTSSWMLNVPGMVQLLRLPGMNMMSHNRFVFVTGFAILALAATGLSVLWEQKPLSRKWIFALPAAVVVVLLVSSVYRIMVVPEPIKSEMADAVSKGAITAGIRSLEDVALIKENFIRRRMEGVVVASVCLGAWVLLIAARHPRRWIVAGAGVIMITNLLWFGSERAPQFARDLFGRSVPLLQELAAAPPGRITGFECLPANLAQLAGLRDIRGYDGIDPARMIDLLRAAAAPGAMQLEHAITQWLSPLILRKADGGWRASPILDMLNVRYIVFRGNTPPGIRVDLRRDDYQCAINPYALPRAFVPASVIAVESDTERLSAIASPDFDPRRVAYVERGVSLPGYIAGSAAIISETPTEIVIAADMQTVGLLVLSDLWDAGWHARIDRGAELEILRTNHAIRGVILPAGRSSIRFYYSPASFWRGLFFAIGSLCLLMAWLCFAAGRLLRSRRLQLLCAENAKSEVV